MTAKNQTILALDSALGSGSVAIARDGQVVAFKLDAVKGMQARNLVPMIESALLKANTSYDALDCIVSTVGPGSFTGIRIALSTARAIGLASGKPVYGVSTLACLAYDALQKTSKELLCILPTGKGDCYTQRFSNKPFAPIGEAVLTPISELQNAKLQDEFWVGVAERETKGLEAMFDYQAQMHAGIAALIATSENASAFLLPPDPLYIRPPDITMPRQTVAAS